MNITKKDSVKLMKAAARGARFLDKHEPGWWGKIDVGGLEMENSSHCICGQLFMEQAELACKPSGFDWAVGEILTHKSSACTPAIYYGFNQTEDFGADCAGSSIDDYVAAGWEWLAESWICEIKERANEGTI